MPTLKAASFEERMIQTGIKSVGRGGERPRGERKGKDDKLPVCYIILIFYFSDYSAALRTSYIRGPQQTQGTLSASLFLSLLLFLLYKYH